MSMLQAVCSLEEPFAVSCASKQQLYEGLLPELSAAGQSTRVTFCRGEMMESAEDFYKEISAAWQFPYYFGFNAAAVIDCLTDLAWAPAQRYLFVILDANLVLSKEPNREITGFLGDLKEVSRRWREDMVRLIPSGQSVPCFSTLFQCSVTDRELLMSKLQSAGVAISTM